MGEHRSLQIKRAQIVVDEQCQSMKKVHTHTHTHPEGLLIPRSVRPVVVVGANVLILFTKPRPADDRATYALNPILTMVHMYFIQLITLFGKPFHQRNPSS